MIYCYNFYVVNSALLAFRLIHTMKISPATAGLLQEVSNLFRKYLPVNLAFHCLIFLFM